MGFHWVHWSSGQTTGNPGSATGTLLPASGPITVTYAGERSINRCCPPRRPTTSCPPRPTPARPLAINRRKRTDSSCSRAEPRRWTRSRSRGPSPIPCSRSWSLGNSQDGTTCSYQFGAYGESFTIPPARDGRDGGPRHTGRGRRRRPDRQRRRRSRAAERHVLHDQAGNGIRTWPARASETTASRLALAGREARATDRERAKKKAPPATGRRWAFRERGSRRPRPDRRC